tara:strand:- start:603 stop:875 length:273 start_codon:yes stop_codon:yes gene_type:complete
MTDTEYVTKVQAVSLAQEAGRAAAQELLTALGIDTSSQESMIQVQVDNAYLRRSRKSSEAMVQHGKKIFIGLVIAGTIGAIWAAIKKTGG